MSVRHFLVRKTQRITGGDEFQTKTSARLLPHWAVAEPGYSNIMESFTVGCVSSCLSAYQNLF